MPAQLLSLSDGSSFLLDKPILLFGRDLECDIRFDSRKVSRKHCCIAQVSNYLVVRDLGSTNGIRINGVRVLEGRLRPGDELTIAHYRYQVRWDEQAVPGRRRSAPVPLPDATAQSDDDAMLEMCDEPVPLSDGSGPVDLPDALPVSEPAPRPAPPKSNSHALPDSRSAAPRLPELPLAPASGSSWNHHPPGPAV